jgi:hypothetical protein
MKCPKNTYSNGGGFAIDGYFGEWATALNQDSKMMQESTIAFYCYKFYCKYKTELSSFI